MGDTDAEYRARVACRIYLKLFDAGDQGAIISYDDMLDSTLEVPRDHRTVQEILKRLCDEDAIHRPDNSRPHLYILLPDAWSRMANRFGADPVELAQLVRLDLDAFDRRRVVPVVPGDNWLNYDVRIRTGQLDREPI
ncbi:MAG: hypothetical protein ACRYGP_16835 [Janthinobacterium lividum]